MNKTDRIHKFTTNITLNGETLTLHCQMDSTDWIVRYVTWDGINITKLLKTVCPMPRTQLRGHVSISVLAKARERFNQKFYPKEQCPGITGTIGPKPHTFLYS